MALRKLFLVIFAIFCLYSTFTEAAPQQCQETTVQYNAIYKNFSISIFADLKIASPNNITVTNITATATNLTQADDTSIIFKNMCGWERSGNITFCNNKFTDSITFPVTDSNVVELQVSMGYVVAGNESDVTPPPPFYSGVFDANSFSFYDGRIYDENNKCYNFQYKDNTVQFNVSECCTSMIPINITNSVQTCIHFNSTSIITNDADKSTYASMVLEYDLINGNVTMFGKYSGPLGYQPYLIVDDAQGCTETLNNTIYCGYPLYSSGNKLLILLSESFNDTAQIYGYANKIIIRGNQTLMSEDKPFTPSNMCQTINATYDSNRKLSISTFSCCTTFQDNGSASPSLSPSPSSSTVTSGSESFSNLNFLSLFLSLIVSVVIFL